MLLRSRVRVLELGIHFDVLILLGMWGCWPGVTNREGGVEAVCLRGVGFGRYQ